jgi:hypothetical protein
MGSGGLAAVTLPEGDDGSVGWRRSDPDFKSQSRKGAGMGDKGGKKDKEKNKQQQVTKHKQEEQKKHDNAPAHKPVPGSA